MKLGTKSILYGVHAFWWHPLTVYLAWRELYGAPNWKECVCIFIHDLGYFGKENMDGPEGEDHPRWAARWALHHLDKEHSFHYRDLCIYHSRTTAAKHGVEPSKLCWADKLSCHYDPWWFYLARALLTGEIKEYRQDAAKLGDVPLSYSHYKWFQWACTRQMKKAYERDARPAYTPGS